MKVAKAFAVTGTLIMFFTLAYGFIAGDFFKRRQHSVFDGMGESKFN